MYAQKPWLEHYEPHVSEHLDYPQMTLPAALAKTAAEHPNHPVIVFKDRRLTYRELDDAVTRFAAALKQLGVAKGSLVAIHLPNCPQFAIAYFATLRLGAIVVPCNPVYTARELIHQLNDSGASVIVTLSATYPLIRQIRSQTALQHVIVAKIKSYFPTLLRWLFTVAAEKKAGHRVRIAGETDTYWFQDLLTNGPAEATQVDISQDDTAVLMYTGGTTGISKGAQLTHQNILVNAHQVRVWADAHRRAVTILAALPLFHSYGMTTCMNPAALGPGTMILVPDPRNVTDILETIHKQRPQMYPGVPALYVAIINHPDVARYDLSCLEFCNSGAAPLPLEVQQRFQELTGARLVEGYGLSEASPVTHGNPAFGQNRIGTIGLPWPDTEAKIVDPETGEQLQAVGQPGELCVRGPQVMKGYWRMPTETANALRPDPQGGRPWLHTGDIGLMDEDGYFRVVDRLKDMILGAGGFNIYPREIEEVLFEYPQILEAAVTGVPVEGKGERVKAYVVLKPGQSATEQEIIAFCRQNLAPHKVPSFVEFRDQLPKSQVGKILRRELNKKPADS